MKDDQKTKAALLLAQFKGVPSVDPRLLRADLECILR